MGYAAGNAPWGSAQTLDIQYQPSKALYDLTSGKAQDVVSVMDRISFLNNLYGADPFDSSIVVVIHGDSIPYFVHKNFKKYSELMTRARSLTVGGTIEFRMCKAAAKLMGYEPGDVHGFVKMVPMADAEIVRMQVEEGYAYMQ